MRTTTHLAGPLATLVVGLAALGCGRGGTYVIEERRTIPAPRPEQTVPADTRMRFMAPSADPHAGHGHPPGAHPEEGQPPDLDYDLPEGWSELPPAQFRDANFAIPARPKLECYVTILPGGGGGVAANVNRWRGQMGAEPLTGEQILALPKIRLLGGDAPYVEIDGTFKGEAGSTMAAAIADVAGASVTAKLIGPAADVRAEVERFKALCASLSQPAAEAAPAPSAPTPGAGGFDPSQLKWTAPAGWTPGPAKSMRAVTFVPADGAGAECYVAILTGDGGGLAANVNRWRGQLSLAPLGAAELAALEKVTVLGREARFVEIDGGAQGMLGLVCELGAHSVFVKMTGPTETLKRERERFLEFCRSLS